MEGVRTVFEAEMNAVTDNPLVFPEEDLIVSGGNFHGQPLALAMDRLALAVHEWASMSERRTFKMLSGQRGLPAFLAADPGLNSGYMIPQYTAASLVSHNKQLCTPSSADNADSSNGQEDHVSMGANGALKMWKVVGQAEQVVAIEAMCAAQASDFREFRRRHGASAAGLQTSFREVVPFLEKDAVMAPLDGRGQIVDRVERSPSSWHPMLRDELVRRGNSLFRWRSFLPLALVPPALWMGWEAPDWAHAQALAGLVLGGGTHRARHPGQDHRSCSSRHFRQKHL